MRKLFLGAVGPVGAVCLLCYGGEGLFEQQISIKKFFLEFLLPYLDLQPADSALYLSSLMSAHPRAEALPGLERSAGFTQTFTLFSNTCITLADKKLCLPS